MNPRFPIYIPSKGRAETQLTMRHLDEMGVDYRVIVEAQEVDAYAAAIDRAKLLVLDPAYQARYETRDAAGDAKGLSRGSGPARNFAWDHALELGARWHWVMDDNIRGFYRTRKNTQIRVGDGTVLRCMEDFIERYSNVGMAGPNYYCFAKRKQLIPPFIINTRLFSCNLIRTDLPFRWRCRYNEDADLSLRILKAGYCTVQFNAFLQNKMRTQSMRGGNTDAFYKSEGTLVKSRSLVRLHPDCARVTKRFGRWHHYIDFSGFTQKLVRAPEAHIPHGIDDYGMRLVTRAAA
jgi:hypothetical protein